MILSRSDIAKVCHKLPPKHPYNNVQVGYCQGMSQVAALLLMYLEREEDAFWGLHKLMVGNLYRMHGLFIPNFPKLIRYKTGLSLIFISTVACGHFNLRIYGAFQLSLEGLLHCRFQIKIKLICRLTNDKDQALISISS